MDDALSVQNLLAGARRFAHLAMAAHDRSDQELFALHGGVAVERLAKAALAAKNPALLLEMRGKVDALFHLTGVKPSETRIHTVGAKDAIARLRALDVLDPDPKLDDLIELRNGVAHATHSEGDSELLLALVRTVEALLTSLGQDPDAFWERWLETIRIAIDEARTELEREVRIRIQKARNVFEDRFDGLPTDAVTKFQATQLDSFAVASTTEKDIFVVEGVSTCPACDGRANVTMRNLKLRSGRTSFVASELSCPMCRMTLAGLDEFAAAGLNLGQVNNQVVVALVTNGTNRLPISKATDLHLKDTQPG
ncbi:hypothetical protein [Streptomyces sp. HUAS ZL42]|uniref:hypothetical protein n=1 Tax=Streptomyces sp. HUAS ZL42 TaxID=3231715 RepID=UPI00345E6905